MPQEYAEEGYKKNKASIRRRKIKDIKDTKLKVQASIMDDKLRSDRKKIDDLQAVISFLPDKDYGVPLPA